MRGTSLLLGLVLAGMTYFAQAATPATSPAHTTAMHGKAIVLPDAAYRRVAWTGKHLQVTLMSIEPGGAIGLEVHHGTDQFLRIDAGSCQCRKA